ncbi:PAS domain S-box-containing protein [Mariprofundus ferrinatatus]|uniref:histidine kinase n=1 Tax=Mariprofundus ferrinatatus TaxID=1921087 RepID=A0A2K8L3H1_9PROT|nr:ATP-binding protein [Mariprofundus ferrinatatus]ATX81827.1 PAS domain S-box-containing protein [Mariprofundus ferrinatatus]
MKLSLRWLLPSLLVACTVILSVWSYQTNGRIAELNVEQDQLQHITLEMDQLQRHIELQLREGMIASVQEEISTLGVDPDVEIAFLSDHHDEIVASIFFATVGNTVEEMANQHLGNSRDIRLEQFEKTKNSLSSTVFVEGEGVNQKVIGIYPVVMGRKEGELRPTLIGILYSQRSMARVKEAAMQGVTRQIIQFVAMLSLFTILLSMTLHFLVTARIRRIVDTTRLVSEGNLNAQTNVAGEDEVGQVASAIDSMVMQWGKAEARLVKLSQGVEQSSEAMIIMDYQGCVEYVNPAFCRISGYASEEIVGDLALWFRNRADPAGRALWETMILGNIWHGRIMSERKDGSQYPCMLTVSPVKGDDGKIVNFVGVQQDLTEHENLEEQLRQSQKLEALGTLVGGIAHEFNNALAGMTGNLYLAKREASALPGVVKRLESVEKLSFRSAELIKNLLSFARKGIVQKTDIPLAPFLKEIIKIYKTSLPENIKLNTDITLPMVVYGDATLLQQTVMNIINNARDAVLKSEDPVISIKLGEFVADKEFLEMHPELKSGDYAIISIRDSGCGIRHEDMPHIFEPFYTTKEVGKGSGLGLSQVYGAMQTHGGAVEIESVPEVGTLVRLYLPAVDRSIENEFATQQQEQVENGNGETIMLVDDDSNVLSTASDVLESLNYKVLTATNGQEAIAQFNINREAIDLVIIDVVMPVMGGIEAVQHLREIEPGIKIIFSTGYDRDSLREAGSIDSALVISKPFNVAELSRAIKNKLAH